MYRVEPTNPLGIVAYVLCKFFTWRDDKEDLIHIGYKALVRAQAKYRPDGGRTFLSFATLCIRRDIIKYLCREKAKMSHFEMTDMDEILDKPPEYDRSLITRETINELVKVLTERDREIVHLHFVQGYRQDEIAKLIGTTRQRVQQILTEACTRMREEYVLQNS